MAQLGGKRQKLPSILRQSLTLLDQQPYQPLKHQKVIFCLQFLNNIKVVHWHWDRDIWNLSPVQIPKQFSSLSLSICHLLQIFTCICLLNGGVSSDRTESRKSLCLRAKASPSGCDSILHSIRIDNIWLAVTESDRRKRRKWPISWSPMSPEQRTELMAALRTARRVTSRTGNKISVKQKTKLQS